MATKNQERTAAEVMIHFKTFALLNKVKTCHNNVSHFVPGGKNCNTTNLSSHDINEVWSEHKWSPFSFESLDRKNKVSSKVSGGINRCSP